MFVASCHSLEVDAEGILEELFENLDQQLEGKTPSAGILLSCIDIEHEELVEGISAKWPEIELIGCTAYGEFSSQQGFADDSASLTLFCSDHIDITAGIGHNIGDDLDAACQEAVNTAKSKTEQETVLCITLTESLVVSGDNIVDSLQSCLGDGVPIIGGMAADGMVLEKTYQYYKGEAVSAAVPILLFSGPLNFSYGIASGWHTAGDEGTVTRTTNNIVHEIDNKPAIEFYRIFAGPGVHPTGEIPLAILGPDGKMDYLRAPYDGYDTDTGAMTFYANIPQGAKVKMTVHDRESIIQGSGTSMQRALDDFPTDKEPVLIFCISCCARKLMLGNRTHEEVDLLINNTKCKAPVVGFYSYGEYGPRQENRESHFHNETFVTLILGEQ